MRRRTASIVLLAVYIGSIWAANWLTTRFGLIAAGFGFVTTAGTFAAGGAIMTRDFLQDAAGRIGVFAAIVAGAALSYATSSHQIAVASGVTFLIGETIELIVYTPLRRRVGWGTGRWSGVIATANSSGLLLDTFLFLYLAGFPVTTATYGGQLLGKAYVTAGIVLAGVVIRRAVLRQPRTSGA